MGPSSRRLSVTASVELDLDALEEVRAEHEAQGTLDLFPGEPEEWRSFTDVIDLMQSDPPAIVRAELVEVSEGPPPYRPPKPAGWRRWFKWLPLFGAILVALTIASSSSSAPTPAPIIGTSGADVLDGTPASDVIKGRAGDDLIRGHRGDDGLLGGRGADVIIGGRGHDYIEAGRGGDTVKIADGVFDLVESCGAGVDTVVRDALDFVALDCEHVRTVTP